MRRFSSAVSLLLVLSFTIAQAQVSRSGAVIAQTPITTITLGPNQIGVVKTAEGITTRIAFSAKVTESICGDLYDAASGKGTFVVQNSGNDVFVKPIATKGMSNLFVITGEGENKHIYSFDLQVVKPPQAHRVVNVVAAAGAQRPELSTTLPTETEAPGKAGGLTTKDPPQQVRSASSNSTPNSREVSGVADDTALQAEQESLLMKKPAKGEAAISSKVPVTRAVKDVGPGTVDVVPSGVVSGAGRSEPPPPEPPKKEAPKQEPPKIIRKSSGVVSGEAIRKTEPVYPSRARAARIGGSVVVEVTVDESGNVIAARAVSGHPMLTDAAVNAARGWKFDPTKVSGQPVRVVRTITFNFSL